MYVCAGGRGVAAQLVHAAGDARGGRAHQAGARDAVGRAGAPPARRVVRAARRRRAALQRRRLALCVSIYTTNTTPGLCCFEQKLELCCF